MQYTYLVIRENIATGARTGKPRKITRYNPLKINGLYCHLGSSYKGFWRVLELVEQKELDDQLTERSYEQ